MVLPALPVQRLPHAHDLPLPRYATDGAVGLDLCSAVPIDDALLLDPGESALVPTGLTMALPDNLEGQIRPRSGLAAKYGITVLNAPGTIDPDYRGEVKVLLVNLGDATFRIERGDRIAQLVIAPIVRVDVQEFSSLDDTIRGQGGFGSTGTGA